MGNANAPFGLRPFNGDDWPEQLIPVTVLSGVSVSKGDPIRLSGGLAIRVLTTQNIYGVAQHDVDGVTGVQQQLLVYPARKDRLWAIQSGTTGDVTIGNVGITYGMGGSSGGMYLSVAVTVNGQLRTVMLHPSSAYGTYAQLIATIQKSQFTGDA